MTRLLLYGPINLDLLNILFLNNAYLAVSIKLALSDYISIFYVCVLGLALSKKCLCFLLLMMSYGLRSKDSSDILRNSRI